MTVPSLRDQRIVVIGGSSGIGFAVAPAALAEGAKVVIGSGGDANGQAFLEGVGAFEHLVFTAGDWAGNPAPSSIADL